MADNYLSFNYKKSDYTGTSPFDGYRLNADFGGFVVNEGLDLTFFNPSFSHDFTTPQFGNQSYFIGTTREAREFSFPIAFEDITLTEYRDVLRWLDGNGEGVLSFDYNANYGYDVKVNSITEAKYVVNWNGGSPLYNVDMTVNFITKNDWAARWIGTLDTPDILHWDATGDYINNSEGNNFIVPIDTYFYVYNYNNTTNYFKVSWSLNNYDTAEVLIDSNIVLATVAELDVYDGYELQEGDLILLTGQTTAYENGLYFLGQGPGLVRTSTYDDWADLYQLGVYISNGTTYGGTYYRFSIGSTGIIDTDPITSAVWANYTITDFRIFWASGSYDVYTTQILNATIYTEYGIGLDENNEFIEVSSVWLKGIEYSENIYIKAVYTNYDIMNGDYVTVTPISREII